jgi:hypothetical protein
VWSTRALRCATTKVQNASDGVQARGAVPWNGSDGDVPDFASGDKGTRGMLSREIASIVRL